MLLLNLSFLLQESFMADSFDALAATSNAERTAVYKKAAWRLIPFLCLCLVAAYLDRVNVGFAKLQMMDDLAFSNTVYGVGAGIFFLGYVLFEVPSNILLHRVGARMWIARIMITWGLIGAAMAFVQTATQFYVLRFLLGACEAGFFPGIILYLTYWFPGSRRTKVIALFMTAIAISNVIGAPVSGAIMQYMQGIGGLRGWEWLFLLEGIPSVLVGFLVFVFLPDGPRKANWLDDREKDFIVAQVALDDAGKDELGKGHRFSDAFTDFRVWALALVYFSGVVCFYAINFWMPTIIQELGIDKKDFFKVGLLSMIPWGISAVVMVLWGAHSDKTGERRWHVAGSLLLTVVGLIGLTLVGHAPIPSLIALTLVASGTLSFVATFWSLPTAFLSGTAAAAGIAFVNSVGNLGGHFGPDLIGRVRTMSGGANEAAFWALASVALLGAVITLVLPKTQKKIATT
jgi:D-galactonate transporter